MKRRSKSGIWMPALAAAAIVMLAGTIVSRQESACRADNAAPETITDVSSGSGGDPGAFGAVASVDAPPALVPIIPIPRANIDELARQIDDADKAEQLGPLMLPLTTPLDQTLELLKSAQSVAEKGDTDATGGRLYAPPDIGVQPPVTPQVVAKKKKDKDDIFGHDLYEFGVALKDDKPDWVPRNPGKTMATARIYQRIKGSKGDWEPTSVPARITFHFYKRSNEAGDCMNHGKWVSPDLYFKQMENWDMICSGDAFYCDTAKTRRDVTAWTANINCEDFGAFSTIEAMADGCMPLRYVIDPKTKETKVVECTQAQARVKIPRDDNDNQIADGYSDVFNSEKKTHPKATEDNDEDPVGNGVVGDGLTAYEEYRGFMIKSSHMRTPWNKKDLFIHDRNELGFDKFPAASGFFCHSIDAGEYDGDENRVINFGKGHANAVTQHGLLLELFQLNDDYGGLTSSLGPPRNVEWVRIQNHHGSEDPHDWDLGSIAHELGHATGVDHHSSFGFYETGHWEQIYPDTFANKLLHTTSSNPTLCGCSGLPSKFWIGEKHNQMSGDWNCLMRYYNYTPGLYKTDGKFECASPGLGSHSYFCTSQAGTGANAGGHNAGDAEPGFGACKNHLIVNDQ